MGHPWVSRGARGHCADLTLTPSELGGGRQVCLGSGVHRIGHGAGGKRPGESELGHRRVQVEMRPQPAGSRGNRETGLQSR